MEKMLHDCFVLWVLSMLAGKRYSLKLKGIVRAVRKSRYKKISKIATDFLKDGKITAFNNCTYCLQRQSLFYLHHRFKAANLRSETFT